MDRNLPSTVQVSLIVLKYYADVAKSAGTSIINNFKPFLKNSHASMFQYLFSLVVSYFLFYFSFSFISLNWSKNY